MADRTGWKIERRHVTTNLGTDYSGSAEELEQEFEGIREQMAAVQVRHPDWVNIRFSMDMVNGYYGGRSLELTITALRPPTPDEVKRDAIQRATDEAAAEAYRKRQYEALKREFGTKKG